MRKVIIILLVLINIISIEFFYAVKQRTDHLAFCGYSYYQPPQQNENTESSITMDEEAPSDETLANFLLKRISFDVSEDKIVSLARVLPENHLVIIYLTVNNSFKPSLLLTTLIFKPS